MNYLIFFILLIIIILKTSLHSYQNLCIQRHKHNVKILITFILILSLLILVGFPWCRPVKMLPGGSSALGFGFKVSELSHGWRSTSSSKILSTSTHPLSSSCRILPISPWSLSPYTVSFPTPSTSLASTAFLILQ